jgi:hypothetical protein
VADHIPTQNLRAMVLILDKARPKESANEFGFFGCAGSGSKTSRPRGCLAAQIVGYDEGDAVEA